MPDPTPNREPADEHFERLLERRTASIAGLARDLRALVRSTLPDINWVPNRGAEGVAFGANQYDHDGWGVGVVGVAKDWVTLGFMRGAHLPDPRGIIEGTGRNVRHVKIRSAQELDERRDALVSLLHAATGAGAPAPVQGALDLDAGQQPDEPVRHSALAAERSQAQQVVAGAQSAVASAQSAVAEAQSAVAEAVRSVIGRVGAARGGSGSSAGAAAKKPAAKKPAAKKPAAKKPAAKKPAAKKPAVKKPAAKKPAAKKPAAKKPAAEKPAAKKPAAKKPAPKKPAAKKPAAKKPATKKPAARKPAARKR